MSIYEKCLKCGKKGFYEEPDDIIQQCVSGVWFRCKYCKYQVSKRELNSSPSDNTRINPEQNNHNK